MIPLPELPWCGCLRSFTAIFLQVVWGRMRPTRTGWWKTLVLSRPWPDCRTFQRSTWLSAAWVTEAVFELMPLLFFSVLNVVSLCFSCSQLKVLHLLSPVQKAELLMRPEVASLDNTTLTLIFHNLLTGGSHPKPTAFPGGGHNWTSPLYPPMAHDPQLPLSRHNGLREVLLLI